MPMTLILHIYLKLEKKSQKIPAIISNCRFDNFLEEFHKFREKSREIDRRLSKAPEFLETEKAQSLSSVKLIIVRLQAN